MGMFDTFFNQFSKQDTKELAAAQDEAREPSFAPPTTAFDDASVLNTGVGAFVTQGYSYSGDSTSTMDEKSLINKYRELDTQYDISSMVDEIVYQAVVCDFIKPPVKLEVPDDLKLPKSVTKRLGEEMDVILHKLDFVREGQRLFRRFYVDGKVYFHAIVDPKRPADGIKAVRFIDPRAIKRVIETETVTQNGVKVKQIKDQYFQYTADVAENGFMGASVGGQNLVKVHVDAVAYANCGYFKEKSDGTTLAVSPLDKAIKPANQLRALEDASVINRLVRAPERRVFYVDVGNLPKTKAEQFLHDTMNRFRNKLSYDSTTGEIKDQKNNLSMLEDFWLPRREGSRGTEVSTLPGSQGLGEMDDILYFKNKLQKSLGVPSSRTNSDATFSAGRSAEITREEVKFAQMIDGFRVRFTDVFTQLLKVQVLTKNIMDIEDFEDIKNRLIFVWETNSYWRELMDNEVWQTRLGLLQQVDMFVGKYFSRQWVKTNVLMLTNEEQRDMQTQIDKEAESDVSSTDDETPEKTFIDRNNDGIPDRPVGAGGTKTSGMTGFNF